MIFYKFHQQYIYLNYILYQNQLKETGMANFEPITILAGKIDGGTLEPRLDGEVVLGDAFSIAITAPGIE